MEHDGLFTASSLIPEGERRHTEMPLRCFPTQLFRRLDGIETRYWRSKKHEDGTVGEGEGESKEMRMSCCYKSVPGYFYKVTKAMTVNCNFVPHFQVERIAERSFAKNTKLH